MGDPKRPKKNYSGPSHPWQKARIEEEGELYNDYKFKNKKELWKANSLLRNFMRDAKRITARRTEQSKKEGNDLLARIAKIGLLPADAKISDILNIQLKQLMERRLQTLVVRKALARTMDQARQFIVHKHITVNGHVMNSPSYYVTLADENSIAFRESSSLSDNEHPERTIVKTAPVKVRAQKSDRDKRRDSRSNRKPRRMKEEHAKTN